MRILLLAAAALILIPGCFQQIAVDSMTGIMENGFTVLNEEQDLELAETSIAANLKLLESVLRTDSGNTELLLLTCRGYASYAMGFVEDEDPRRAREFYRRGMGFGLKILNRDKRLASALAADPTAISTALKDKRESDVPAIFWTAVSWAGYISQDLSDPDGLADLPKVEALMNFVLEKNPLYFYGGADFVLGTIKAKRPAALGGQPDSARAHFERAIALEQGRFLLTYVFYAESYAFQVQDKDLFLKCLTIVDSTSIDVLPEARLSNAIAKKKAKRLINSVDELF